MHLPHVIWSIFKCKMLYIYELSGRLWKYINILEGGECRWFCWWFGSGDLADSLFCFWSMELLGLAFFGVCAVQVCVCTSSEMLQVIHPRIKYTECFCRSTSRFVTIISMWVYFKEFLRCYMFNVFLKSFCAVMFNRSIRFFVFKVCAFRLFINILMDFVWFVDLLVMGTGW